MMKISKPIIAFDQYGQPYFIKVHEFNHDFHEKAKFMTGNPISLSGAYQIICEKTHELMDNDQFKLAAQLWQGDWFKFLSDLGLKVIIDESEWENLITPNASA